MTDFAFVVESVVINPQGGRMGVARVYVATAERAQQIVADAPADGSSPRTYRQISLADMPPQARENLLAARST